MIDSYRLALGDFEITESFSDNTDYEFLFWVLYFIGSLVSLLLILNMVIAVMGSTFVRVSEQTEAFILCEKLSLVLENYHRLPRDTIDKLESYKYVLSVEVDPDYDPIAQESMEKRLGDNINEMQQYIACQSD